MNANPFKFKNVTLLQNPHLNIFYGYAKCLCLLKNWIHIVFIWIYPWVSIPERISQKKDALFLPCYCGWMQMWTICYVFVCLFCGHYFCFVYFLLILMLLFILFFQYSVHDDLIIIMFHFCIEQKSSTCHFSLYA